MSAERRKNPGQPPTVVLTAYQSLGPGMKLAIQVLGIVLVLAGSAALLVVEVLKTMSWVYGLYAAGVVVVGVVLIVPPIGLWLLERIPATLAPILRPDRRRKEEP